MDRMSQEFWFAHSKSIRFLSLEVHKTTPAANNKPVSRMPVTGY